MLVFHPFKPEDAGILLPYLAQNPRRISDLSLGYLMMWKDSMEILWCIENDTLVLRQTINDQPVFYLPTGKDPAGMMDSLIAYVTENNMPLRFYGMDEEATEELRKDPRFHTVPAVFDVRWSDYVYNAEEVLTFRGKKFETQRNHINRFRKLYGEPDVHRLSPEDIPLVEEFLREYAKEHLDANMLEKAETAASPDLMKHMEQLHQIAAGLFAEGRLIAYSVGEVLGDMLIIHTEKALRSVPGAYPVMYQSFVRMACGLHPEIRLVNREDDSGDPGLRISKSRYHPVCRLHKYLAHINSPAPAARQDTVDAGIVLLTPLREEDRSVYYRLCTDPDISRWWGYDYEQDINVTDTPDEDMFFDMTMADMAAGDSVNYAVREHADGELIGEVILWNMTWTGDTEIGCRLFPQYQHRGYGKAAFAAAVRYVRDTLHRIPNARCCKENTASRAMIVSSGLHMCGEDDTYYLFR